MNTLPDILLIDDDPVVHGITKTFLKFTANVDYAESTMSAVEKLNEQQYSIILLDINLGEIKNGVDMLSGIREITGYERVPIIACTAYAMVGDKAKLLRAGFDEYISKPFSSQELIDKIEEVKRKLPESN